MDVQEQLSRAVRQSTATAPPTQQQFARASREVLLAVLDRLGALAGAEQHDLRQHQHQQPVAR